MRQPLALIVVVVLLTLACSDKKAPAPALIVSTAPAVEVAYSGAGGSVGAPERGQNGYVCWW